MVTLHAEDMTDNGITRTWFIDISRGRMKVVQRIIRRPVQETTGQFVDYLIEQYGTWVDIFAVQPALPEADQY